MAALVSRWEPEMTCHICISFCPHDGHMCSRPRPLLADNQLSEYQYQYVSKKARNRGQIQSKCAVFPLLLTAAAGVVHHGSFRRMACVLAYFGVAALRGPWTLILSHKYHLLCTISIKFNIHAVCLIDWHFPEVRKSIDLNENKHDASSICIVCSWKSRVSVTWPPWRHNKTIDPHGSVTTWTKLNGK